MHRFHSYGLLLVTALAAVLVGVLGGDNLDHASVLSARFPEPVSSNSLDPALTMEPTTTSITTSTTVPLIEQDTSLDTHRLTTTTVVPTTTEVPTVAEGSAEQPSETTAPPQPQVNSGFNGGFESDFAARINGYRSSNGLSGLTRDGSLDAEARAWAKRMAEQGSLSHSNIGRFIPPWTAAGENVGSGGSVSSVFGALTGSSGHRANMLGGYTHVGIGVWVDGSGNLWTAHVFTG